jgi:glutathione S-transferase
VILYRCRTPTNWLCACGRVARKLDKLGVDYEEVRVAQRRSQRGEIQELTGQDWVPVIIDGEEVVSDSHRIVEYLAGLSSRAGSPAR